jgi:hypothetical protein
MVVDAEPEVVAEPGVVGAPVVAVVAGAVGAPEAVVVAGVVGEPEAVVVAGAVGAPEAAVVASSVAAFAVDLVSWEAGPRSFRVSSAQRSVAVRGWISSWFFAFPDAGFGAAPAAAPGPGWHPLTVGCPAYSAAFAPVQEVAPERRRLAGLACAGSIHWAEVSQA